MTPLNNARRQRRYQRRHKRHSISIASAWIALMLCCTLSLTLCRKALELSGTERSAAIDITTKCPPSTPSTPSVSNDDVFLCKFILWITALHCMHNYMNVVLCIVIQYTLAVMNIGSPSCGMNAAARSFTRLGLTHGCRMLGIRFGFEGLVENNVML